MNSVAALALVVLSACKADALVNVGSFRNLQHGIAGDVFAKDEKTLVIKGFEYDGAGPDAFFWAGKHGSPSGVGTILPYPFKGKFYEYEDQSAPILTGRYDGSKTITLTLPEDLKVSDIRWLSVWCRAFSVNFGDLFFPDNLEIEGTEEPEPTDDSHKGELPPPLVGNDVGGKYSSDGDADAESEAEAEAESEAEAEAESEAESEPSSEPGYHGNAAFLSSSFSLSLLLPIFAKLL